MKEVINEVEARGLGFLCGGGGGGSGGGRIRRDSYGGMSVVARRKSLSCGIGSGIRRGRDYITTYYNVFEYSFICSNASIAISIYFITSEIVFQYIFRLHWGW